MRYKLMRVEDQVYGEVEICNPLLLELLHSPSIVRLQGIQQYGIPIQYFPSAGFTRYEHSIGTMILLKRLGAEIVEQAAGLLHDISHTAFSHVTDYVWNDEKAQDERHREYFLSSEVPLILAKYGIHPEHVADIDLHPLLERETPDLCADRVDYTLRELALGPRKTLIPAYLESIRVVDGKIVFADFSSAREFARDYLYMHSLKWAGVEKTVRQYIFAETLKAALACKALKVADLFENDEHALRKLHSCQHPKVRALLDILACKLKLETNAESPDLVLSRRQRHIDPEFIHKDGLCRVSRRSPMYRKMLELQNRLHKKGVRVKIRAEPRSKAVA
jgi:HD superfamily phosphohydrolase